MNKTLELTPELCTAIDACRQAESVYLPGRMSASVIELPRLELAAAVLKALTQQALLTRLSQVPKATPAPVPAVQRKRRA